MTRISRLFSVGASLVALCLLGCGGDGSTLGPDGTPLGDSDPVIDDSTTVTVSLARLSTEIFTPKCATAGCHSGSFAPEGMDLSSGAIAAAIIDVPSNQRPGVKRIDPGNPDGSYLIQKIRGTGANSQMPIGGSLSAAELQLIVDWVEAGAPAQ